MAILELQYATPVANIIYPSIQVMCIGHTRGSQINENREAPFDGLAKRRLGQQIMSPPIFEHGGNAFDTVTLSNNFAIGTWRARCHSCTSTM